VRKVLKVF